MGIALTHDEITSIIVTNHILLAYFNFRMAFNKSLNATCDLDRFLFCKMPMGTLEVEVKVKTTWGKFTLVQDTHIRTERYHAWEKADRRSNVKTRKKKSLHQMTKQTEDNASETDVPVGQGFGYPLQVFTDPKYAATIPHMEEEGEVEQEHEFLGKYCKFCD